MEMAQIKYVLAAARTLNFTRAAHECSVSQPALTKAVKNLESELGAPVFHREGKRISLSQFGKSMLPHFQHIIDETEVAHGLAQNFRLLNKVPVRLGVMSTVGHVRLARFLAQFERNHQGVELTVTEDALVDLAVKLRQGEVDIAILNGMVDPGEAMHMHELYTERYVVIFPPDHRLSACDAIRLSDLSGESYVDRLACEMRELVMEVCKEKNINLYARFRSEREDWVQAMVLARIGFAFVPEYSVSLPGLLQRPLIDPTVERHVCLATVPGRPFSPAVSAFVRAAQSYAWPG
jgi:DNA-binding transcriptional LysR family regulator